MNAVCQPSELADVELAQLASIDSKVVPGRACGSCGLCCKVVSIPELAKPAGEWCKHGRPGRGCGIHATRPYVCRGFYCEWMISKGLGPEWKPERSKFVLSKTNGGRRLTAHVDPGYPSAWRRSPYYENFKQWAREAAQQSPDMHVVDVMIREHSIVILPDREVDLGIVGADQRVVLSRKVTPRGEFIEVEKVRLTPALAQA